MGAKGWFWARREIAALDERKDFHRIAQLSFVVRYGTPIFLHGLFSVAFVHNVGHPGMARILYRGGRGPIVRDTRKRNFDSLTFFGEMYRHGDSEPTRRIADRLVRIHSNFAIDNAMSLYTLATLACLPRRLSQRFMGEAGFSAKECEAQYRFWRRIGELMQIHDIPDNQDAFLAWMLAEERERFGATPEAAAIAKALADEWAEYWFPAPLRRTAAGVFYALVDPQLRLRMALPEPTAFQTALTHIAVKGLFLFKRLWADPQERHISDFFGREYGKQIDADKIGYQPEQGGEKA
jgi:hypothetical protein